ncbi:hypothetical protein RB195_022935 [Necator americanus]|uniref:Uncharacterized protein n=1 Tax=Necator americanus TaxID=51031 RepID=A0ABR1EH54_NECAM
MSDVSNSFSAWETLPEDEPPLCIAVRRPVSPPRHYEADTKQDLVPTKLAPGSFIGNQLFNFRHSNLLPLFNEALKNIQDMAEKNSTIIFPFPIDLLSSFLHRPSVKPESCLPSTMLPHSSKTHNC